MVECRQRILVLLRSDCLICIRSYELLHNCKNNGESIYLEIMQSCKEKESGGNVMRKRNAERKKTRCKFGIVPKFLIGILIPLFAVLWAMGIFLGVEVSKTVNQSVSTELGGQSTAASNQVSAFFERYFGMTEGLAATQIVRDITNDKTNDSMLFVLMLVYILDTMLSFFFLTC